MIQDREIIHQQMVTSITTSSHHQVGVWGIRSGIHPHCYYYKRVQHLDVLFSA